MFASSSNWCAMKAWGGAGRWRGRAGGTGWAGSKQEHRHGSQPSAAATAMPSPTLPATPPHLLQLLHPLDQLAPLDQQLCHGQRLRGEGRGRLSLWCRAYGSQRKDAPCMHVHRPPPGLGGPHLPRQQPVVVLQQQAQHRVNLRPGRGGLGRAAAVLPMCCRCPGAAGARRWRRPRGSCHPPRGPAPRARGGRGPPAARPRGRSAPAGRGTAPPPPPGGGGGGRGGKSSGEAARPCSSVPETLTGLRPAPPRPPPCSPCPPTLACTWKSRASAPAHSLSISRSGEASEPAAVAASAAAAALKNWANSVSVLRWSCSRAAQRSQGGMAVGWQASGGVGRMGMQRRKCHGRAGRLQPPGSDSRRAPPRTAWAP